MARPPKKIEASVEAQIIAKLAAGASNRSVAREFGVPEATIRARFKPLAQKTVSVANQLVDARSAVFDLPVAAQCVAIPLADQLLAMQRSIVAAAVDSAAVAAKVASLAKAQADKLAVDVPDNKALEAVANATRIARDAGQMPMQIMALGAEKMRVADGEGDTPKSVTVTVIDASIEPDADPQ